MIVIERRGAATTSPKPMQVQKIIFVRGVLVGMFLSLLLTRIIYSMKSLSLLTASNFFVKNKPTSASNNSVVVVEFSHSHEPTTTTVATGAQSSYSWIGNHWRPPAGVPLYSPQDMRNIFSQEKTLWIGDSTARQDYVTLYNIIVARPSNNNSKGYNIDDITVSDLEHGINVNKKGTITEPCQKHLPNGIKLLLCRSLEKKGYPYDYVEKMCWNDLVDLVTTKRNMLINTYSTIIISVGIWEVLRDGYCGRQNATYIVDVLDTLQQHFVGTNVQIYWKVHCGAENEKPLQMERGATIHQLTRDWFGNRQHQQSSKNSTNMHIVDLAFEMKGRIYGPSRLQGDAPAHVDPLVRTLFLQMTTQAIVQNKQ
jgi:hypothetical protein